MVSLRRSLAVIVWLLFFAPAFADPAIPPLTGRVVDLAHVLDRRTVDALTRQLADHEAATTDQVVVVTLPSLENDTIEDWGRALLNGWGIGQSDKNNGVVLVVAPNDRRLRIAVGYGLESTLTNAAAAAIIENEIVPRFQRGDLSGGVTAGVNAILQTIAGTYHPPIERASSQLSPDRVRFRLAPLVVFPALFIIIVVVLRLRRGGSTRRRRYYDRPGYYGNSFTNNDRWNARSSGGGGGGFSGGGGRGGGGGASGRW
jgi:uncharacterized protein